MPAVGCTAKSDFRLIQLVVDLDSLAGAAARGKPGSASQVILRPQSLRSVPIVADCGGESCLAARRIVLIDHEDAVFVAVEDRFLVLDNLRYHFGLRKAFHGDFVLLLVFEP